MKLISPLAATLTLTFGFLVGADNASSQSENPSTTVVENFDFSNADAMQGWSVSSEAEITQDGDSLAIRASGWDGKIFRTIDLPAGRYVLYGEGLGLGIVKVVSIDWKDNYVTLNLSTDDAAWKNNDEGWRINYRDFEVPGGQLYLVGQVNSADGEANFRAIRIETAPEKSSGEATPSAEQLRKTAAELPVLRGFMTGYYQDSPQIKIHNPGETFSDMKAWGANLARVNVWPPLGWPGMAEPEAFWEKQMPVILNEVETRLAAAQKAGIKVALECHYPPPVDGKLRDHGTADFWAHPATAATMARFWSLIAERAQPYKDTLYGYDLFNEPLDWGQMPYEPREWRHIAIKVIEAIRKIDPTTWIIYETGPGGLVRGFEKMTPLPDDRVIYSPHVYYPAEFVQQGLGSTEGTDLPKIHERVGVEYPAEINGVLWNKAEIEKTLTPVIEFQKKWGVPIYVGEFSVVRTAPKESAVQWLKDTISIFEEHGWSWTYHAFRESLFWSLEHDETPMLDANNPPKPVAYETERAKVVKEAFLKNQSTTQ